MEMPYLPPGQSPSQKEFWISAYLAAMHRLGPEQALLEADKALTLCNQRWNQNTHRPVRSCQFVYNYPLGVGPVDLE